MALQARNRKVSGTFEERAPGPSSPLSNMHVVSSSTLKGNWLLMEYASNAARLHELFDKKYSLFASVKAGSEIIENGFSNGGEQRKLLIKSFFLADV